MSKHVKLRELGELTDAELKQLMIDMARAVESAVHSRNVVKPHFALLVFNHPTEAQYIGNCERASMIQAMKEAAARLERNEDTRRN